MKEIIEKISSYNLFNYLLPGILFVCMSKYLTDYNFILENDFLGVFLYYFIGMVISRFGSLIIEPILKKTSFVKFEAYSDFIDASKKDEKIELFSEVNNTYRTIISLFILLLILKSYNSIQDYFNISTNISLITLSVLILLLFLFSYKKQTSYLSKRIIKSKS